MEQGKLFDDNPHQETLPHYTTLDEARAVAAGCVRCDLSQSRRQVIFGEGAPHARLFVLGEGPSETDDRSGHPFSGPSGGLLDAWFVRLGLRRAEVWLSNVVRCRPAAVKGGRLRNRPPTEREAAACRFWLDTELRLVQPEVILALGGSAGKALLGKNFKITQERGRWQTGPAGIPVLATLHPAYLLRLEDDDLVRAEAQVDADLGAVRQRLATPQS